MICVSCIVREREFPFHENRVILPEPIVVRRECCSRSAAGPERHSAAGCSGGDKREVRLARGRPLRSFAVALSACRIGSIQSAAGKTPCVNPEGLE